MKSITYILIIAISISILFSALPTSISGQSQILKIHSVDDVTNAELLYKSGRIIKNRLDSFGIKNFAITVLGSRNSIEIEFKEKTDTDEITSLLTSKGKFEFYETYDRTEIIEQLSRDDTIFSLLDIPVKGKDLKRINSGAILGFSNGHDKSVIERYLHSGQMTDSLFHNINFVWGYSSNNDSELFLLKKNSLFDGSYISECVGKYYPDSHKTDIIISFSPEGAKLWYEITKQNAGKSIAITMDNNVYYAPRVLSEIENGKCCISGNFSTNEVNKLISLVNNGELPLNFELVK